MKKKNIYIIVSVILLSIIMNIVDMFIKPQYFVKSIIKMVLFLAVPLIYFLINKDERKVLKGIMSPKRKGFFMSLSFAVVCYGIILGFYYLLRNHFDFSNITKSLTADIGVNENNFIFVAIYISICNSFLEEFFFRGFSFITLKNHTSKKFAYIFSSVIFSFYHIGMTFGWVHIFVFILGFIGLIIGGLIFCYLNEKSENIYPSWILHMFINFAINTIGFILFGII